MATRDSLFVLARIPCLMMTRADLIISGRQDGQRGDQRVKTCACELARISRNSDAGELTPRVLAGRREGVANPGLADQGFGLCIQEAKVLKPGGALLVLAILHLQFTGCMYIP